MRQAICRLVLIPVLALAARASVASADPNVQGPSTVQGPKFGLPYSGFGTSTAPAPLAAYPFIPGPPSQPLSNDPTVNTDIFHPPSPFATAQCRDGLFSYSNIASGTCDGHGGVLDWIYPPGTATAEHFPTPAGLTSP